MKPQLRHRPLIKRIALGVICAGLLAGAGFCFITIFLFDRSTNAVYDIPLASIVASSDPAVIARGKHLAESLGKCVQCHGTDLGSGESVRHGPFGISKGPNLTAGNHGVRYTDAE